VTSGYRSVGELEPQRRGQRVFSGRVGSGAQDVLKVGLKRHVLADLEQMRQLEGRPTVSLR